MTYCNSISSGLHRRDVIRQLSALTLGGLSGAHAFAQQNYPARPVTVIMPSAAGGPSDLIGRKLTQLMGEKAGQPFVVDNRPGANGVIGVQAFLRTPPDGHTLMFTTTSTTATNKAMIKDLPYDPTKDPLPIAFGFRTWMAVAVSSKLPFKTVHELVAYAKANPAKLNFGYGTANPQLGGKLFEQLTGTRFTFVPYKSHSAMMLALTSGEVDLTVTDPMSLSAFIKAGSIRALASLSPARLAAMPELPTMSDVGLPSEEMLSAHLFMVRAGTPPDVTARLTELITSCAQSKEFADWIPSTGLDNYLVTGAEAARVNLAEIERIGAIARKSGLVLG